MSRERRTPVSQAIPKRKRQRRPVRKVAGRIGGAAPPNVLCFRLLADYLGGVRWDVGAKYIIARDDGSLHISSVQLVAKVRPRQPACDGRDSRDGDTIAANDAAPDAGTVATGGLGT